MVSSNWEEGVAAMLLAMMIEEYVEIDAHRTASAWMEKYKGNKKSVQKSKSCEKTTFLHSSATSEDELTISLRISI